MMKYKGEKQKFLFGQCNIEGIINIHSHAKQCFIIIICDLCDNIIV